MEHRRYHAYTVHQASKLRESSPRLDSTSHSDRQLEPAIHALSQSALGYTIVNLMSMRVPVEQVNRTIGLVLGLFPPEMTLLAYS